MHQAAEQLSTPNEATSGLTGGAENGDKSAGAAEMSTELWTVTRYKHYGLTVKRLYFSSSYVDKYSQ